MISIINNPNSTVAYYKQEDYDQLIASGIEKRAIEKGGVRVLMEALGYEDLEIVYKESGQPYFKDKPELFLSISHSKGWVALGVGSEPLGIDMETHSSRLMEGQDYFRNAREMQFSEDEQALHLIWGAKEAFYKLKEGQLKDLKEEVTVKNIREDILVLEYGSADFELKYFLVENAFLVFTT